MEGKDTNLRSTAGYPGLVLLRKFAYDGYKVLQRFAHADRSQQN
jgi:hypothetical protein